MRIVYKVYFDFSHQVLGSDVSHLEDTTRLQVYEEYRENEKEKYTKDGFNYRHILVQFTNANGATGMIDIPHSEWTFAQVDMTNDMVRYRPQNEQIFEEIYFVVGELTNENSLLRDYESGKNIDQIANWFPIQSNEYTLTKTNPRDSLHWFDVEDKYAKIIYQTNYVCTPASGGTYDCSAYTCIYDDYENMKRFIIVYGRQGDGKLESSYDIRDFLDDIEFVDNEYHFSQSTSTMQASQGMTLETQKTTMNNGMAINVTNYTNPNNQEIKFHWYGPETLGTLVGEQNGVLTLMDKEENYRLNIQQVALDLGNCKTFSDDELGTCTYDSDTIFIPLQEYEHYLEGSRVDYVSEWWVLYQITTDDGYKGYAYAMCNSDFPKPSDQMYFITYVEKESVYDDERALEVIKSIDYHLGIE